MAVAKSWIQHNRIQSPYLCKILRKDILYNLRLYRSWADVDNTYLRVVSQLRPKRIKKALEEKAVMRSSAAFPYVERYCYLQILILFLCHKNSSILLKAIPIILTFNG